MSKKRKPRRRDCGVPRSLRGRIVGVQVSVRMSFDERRVLGKRASQLGITVPEFVRRCIASVVGDTKNGPSHVPVRMEDGAVVATMNARRESPGVYAVAMPDGRVHRFKIDCEAPPRVLRWWNRLYGRVGRWTPAEWRSAGFKVSQLREVTT